MFKLCITDFVAHSITARPTVVFSVFNPTAIMISKLKFVELKKHCKLSLRVSTAMSDIIKRTIKIKTIVRN